MFQADSGQISESVRIFCFIRHLYFNYISRDIEKEGCEPSPTEVYSKIQYCALNPQLVVASKVP